MLLKAGKDLLSVNGTPEPISTPMDDNNIYRLFWLIFGGYKVWRVENGRDNDNNNEEEEHST